MYLERGTKINQWSALEDAIISTDRILFQCECGTIKKNVASNVKNQTSKRCLFHKTIHGMSHHVLYPTWYQIIERCTNPLHHAYKDYGERGIKVHPRWMNVIYFIEDIEKEIGPRPRGYTLDRIRPNGNYEPNNVKWSNGTGQANNQAARSFYRWCLANHPEWIKEWEMNND